MCRLLIAGFLLFCAATVCAHEIGVTEVTLQQQPGNRYLWRVENPGGAQDAISSPQLPAGCDFIEAEYGEHNRSLYFFQCAKPLGAADNIRLTWRTELVMVKALWLDAEEKSAVFVRKHEVIDVELARLSASSGEWRDAAWRYLGIGVEHILLGVDHLLFVLGILLLASTFRALILAISAFTLAHSLSLGLSFLGWVQLNSAPVEAVIALSIVVLSLEILRAQVGVRSFTSRYLWVACGGFGLLHGLGFAGALADVGVPVGEIPVALLFFNVGVELGQLLFVASVVSCFYGWLYLRQYAGWQLGASGQVKVMSAYVMGSLASFWVLERSAAIFV